MAENPFNQQQPIEGIKHIIAVGSGKGGVGKSTVAANLGLALKKLEHKVGLLDADLHGPSQPRLFGAVNQKLEVGDDKKIEPLQRFNLKIMSIGFLVKEDSAVIWRGPMLFKAMEQFFRDVRWGELDYLIIDLPPGTGDIVLTLAQKVPVSGGLTVCTPQNLALVDAKKAIDMFEKVNIPLLGMVENMTYMQNGKERIQLFPKGELDPYLDAYQIEKLAEVPFHPHVGLHSEAGIPTVESDSESIEALAFKDLAEKITNKLPV